MSGELLVRGTRCMPFALAAASLLVLTCGSGVYAAERVMLGEYFGATW